MIWPNWFKRKGSDESGEPISPAVSKPQLLPQAKTAAELESFSEGWKRLNVPVSEVRVLEQIRGKRLSPTELEAITKLINKELKKNGFDFAVNPQQALGAMFDQTRLMVGKRELRSLPFIAVWREADRQLHQELGLEQRREFDQAERGQLEAKVKSLFAAAKARKEAARLQLMAEGRSGISSAEKPLAAESVEALIRREAQFQARRVLGLGPQDPIPDEELEKQTAIAWEKYRRIHGLEGGG